MSATAAPEPLDPKDGPTAEAVVLRTVRALLRVDSRAAAAAVLHAAVRELGGRVVSEEDGGMLAAEVSLDVSLGVGPPVGVVAGDEPTAQRLRALLPALLEDAEAAAVRCDRYLRQARRARTDALTGLAGRGEMDERLAAAGIGDVVCLLDLDDFKSLNDTRGHAAGDEALRRFGALLTASVRDVDVVGRYGGDEFLVLFDGIPVTVAMNRMRALVRRWSAEEPGGGVSVGLAAVDGRGPQVATREADRALYRAKGAGGATVREAGETGAT